MVNASLKVAIVDDDEVVRRAFRRMIASLSYAPIEFASGEAFLSTLRDNGFVCAIIDLHMPGMNGLDVISEMNERGRAVPSIIITGGDDPKMRERCLKAGASAYMVKPVERGAVHQTILSLIR